MSHPYNFIDKTGLKFGKLTVVKYIGNRKWLCQCECGNFCEVPSIKLTNDINKQRYQTCGCGRKSRLTPNYDFFQTIDSEEKAYIVGFLAADGTVVYNEDSGTYYFKLVLQAKDKELLDKIKAAIGSKVTIKEYIATSNLPQGCTCTSPLCSLQISNKELTKQLINLGVTPNKSLTLDIDYSRIPAEFKKDFWRGLVDGDGTFGIFGKKQILEFNITTSKLMCISTIKEIITLFPNFNINYYQAIGCNKNTKRLIITSQQDIYTFLDYIYKDANIYLQRKYDNYLNIKQTFNYKL